MKLINGVRKTMFEDNTLAVFHFIWQTIFKQKLKIHFFSSRKRHPRLQTYKKNFKKESIK